MKKYLIITGLIIGSFILAYLFFGVNLQSPISIEPDEDLRVGAAGTLWTTTALGDFLWIDTANNFLGVNVVNPGVVLDVGGSASVSVNFEAKGYASSSQNFGAGLTDCDTAATSKVLWDTTTGKFSCGTDQTSAGGVTTLTSTTLQSDAVIATYTAIIGLAFTPVANTNYLIDCYIIYTSTAATTGINFAWDVPAAVTSIHMTGYTTTTALGAIQGFIQRADNVGTPTSAAIITTEQVAFLSAKLRNGANATSTTLGFTPETANSVSVLPGSICQYRTY